MKSSKHILKVAGNVLNIYVTGWMLFSFCCLDTFLKQVSVLVKSGPSCNLSFRAPFLTSLIQAPAN
jgi:hypothetical protein